ncbi:MULTISPECIES: type IV pilus twitching motility protein PilT [Cysteiniphilum]|uniref:type IV pilus twitching motility protein PilT n=1 Tax=Cysteiniphilum TaxID=2056696 RepID=UPI0017838B1E|nr:MULTISPECIES: ATPase, T2SS/T4P/T4SS family [Cysteiniphilum]
MTSIDNNSRYLLAGEPPYFLKLHYDELLLRSGQLGCSDLTFQTNSPVMAVKHGQHIKVTQRALTANEVEDFVNIIYGSNAVAKVLSGQDLDFSYSVIGDHHYKVRFRVNASLISLESRLGLQVSMRQLPSKPPTLDALNLPESIKRLSHVDQGIVLVCGATGSGKSTLLASMLMERAMYNHCGEKIITFEAPIEYLLPSCDKTLVAQTEVPRCLPNFAYAVRNALRRTPTTIMVGEARDRETISAVIEAALTGHSVFSTLHSQSVVQSVNRLLMLFDQEQKQRVYYDFFSTVQAIIWQKLIPTIDGKQVALREYIIIDANLRAQLLSQEITMLSQLIKTAMTAANTTVKDHIEELFKDNIISQETYEACLKRTLY